MKNVASFNDYYQQYKQRLDLDISFTPRKVLGFTKLCFKLQNQIDLKSIENDHLLLKLNCDNINIKSIYLKTKEILNYLYIPPNKIKEYLQSLYLNIEDYDSLVNINRIEFENKREGNLHIIIPTNSIFNRDLLAENKIKIIIEYELDEKFTGFYFQSFYDEKIDVNYNVCYTPNFYYNTTLFCPCIYDLKLQIIWRLNIIVNQDYYAFCSSHLTCIYHDSNNKKKNYSYKTKEPLCAKNIGIAVVYQNVFTVVEDPLNRNIIYIINEIKKPALEKALIQNGLINLIFSFYEEFFETDINNNSINFLMFVPYLALNSSSKLDKTVKNENYFNIIKFPHLYIIPEKYIFNESVHDTIEYQLRTLSKLFITNYIGGLINEYDFADFWLICSLENWLRDCFLQKYLGNMYIKKTVHDNLRKLKNICKNGLEKRPLYTNNYYHPTELQLDNILFIKSNLVIHMLEHQVERIFLQKALKNIINERSKNGYTISTEFFTKLFKKNCGINLKNFMNLWILKTGMLELQLTYNYNKSSNSIDIDCRQIPVSKKYYDENPHFKIKDIDMELLNTIDKKLSIVDFKCKSIRYFDVPINISIFQTNGIEILKENHIIKLENEKDLICQNFPLISKFRKAPIKKREQEFIQDLISNTSINKIYSTEEIERIIIQNPIMWLRADSEITHLRKVLIKQQHILYDYIKLFKENEIVGQFESLKNIYEYKDKKSLTILETFIKTQTIFYKLRIYAIKIYVKLILLLRYEEGYSFLLEVLEDCYSEILKNKTQLNKEMYFVLKHLIKHLGNYKEENFNEFIIIGKVINSSIQNRIIDRFLRILLSNDLIIINGFNDSYITREILIGCSKLNMQDKTFVLLKKIVKLLRIEKLKRSYNEIIILASIEAFLNVLIKNEFYVHEKQNSQNKIMIQQIIEEIEYYNSTENETFELRNFLHYFQFYLIYYKSNSLGDYFTYFYNYCKEDLDNENYDNYISKIHALSIFLEKIPENENENLNSLINSILKDLIVNKMWYYRIDVRIAIERIFKNHCCKNSTNKNLLKFSGKKYADEVWLYTFAREEKSGILKIILDYRTNSEGNFNY